MKLNLIEMAKDLLSENALAKITSTVGLSPDSSEHITGKAIPALLGALGEKAQNPEGATEVFSVVQDSDDGILDNLSGFFDGDNSDILAKGQDMLGKLMGGRFDMLKSALEMIPGLSGGKAGSLLSAVLPLVTGMLGKQVKSGGMNIAGLTGLLDDQKEFVADSLGGDFTERMGFGSLLRTASTDIPDGTGDSLSGKVSGVVTGGAVTAAGAAISGASGTIGGSITGAKDAAGNAIGAAKDTLSGAAGSVTGAIGGAVSGAAGSVTGAAGDAIGAAKDTLSGAAGSVTGAIGGAAGSVGGAVSGAAGSVTGAAGDAIGAAKDTLSGAAGSVTGAVSGAAGSVGGAVSGAAGSVTGAAGDAAAAGGGLLKKIIPVALLGLLAFFGWKKCSGSDKSLTDVAKGVGGAASGAIDAAGDAAGGAMDAAGNAVDSAGDAIGGAAGAAGDALSGAADAAGNVADSAGDAIGGAANAAGDALSGAADAAGNVVDSAGDAIEGAAGAAGDTLSGAADAAGNVVDSAGDALSGAAGAAGNVIDGATDAAGNAVDAAGNAIDGAAGAAGDTIDEAADAAENAADTAAEAATSTTHSFIPASEDGSESATLSENVKGLATQLFGAKAQDPAALEQVYEQITASDKYTFVYRIPFATGETGVPSAHQAPLTSKLQTAPAGSTLVTIGYADTRGDDALNNRLSYGRAKEVGGWIKSTLGGDSAIESFSMGETDRFSKEEFAKNRVVEVWAVTQ